MCGFFCFTPLLFALFLSFLRERIRFCGEKQKNPIKTCDLFEKTIDFGHRMRFLKIFARKNRGQWQNSKGTSLWLFARLELLEVGLRFLCHFGRFLQKNPKVVCYCG